MFQIRMSAIVRSSFLVQSLPLLVLLLISSPVQANDACASATPVELNTTFRTYADMGEPLLVELEIPSAGILSVDIGASNTFSSDVGNGLLSLECLPRAASKPIVVERSAGHLMLAVNGPGAYVFRVASVDRGRALRELKLRSAFVHAAATGDHGYGEDEDDVEVDGFADPGHGYGEDEDDIEVDGFADPGHSYGEDEDDIEVDGFADPGHTYGEDEDDIEVDGFADAGHSYGEDEDDIEVDGLADPGYGYGEDEDDIRVGGFANPGHSYGEDDIEVDGFADPGHGYGEDEDDIEVDGFADPISKFSSSFLFKEMCRLGEVDDHGDSFHCATHVAVGDSVDGEIGNGWRDDADTFRFLVGGSDTDLRVLVIETRGRTDTISVLYDQTGQRLDVNSERGHDGNYRIARALRPGAYFVRVQGSRGSEGPYGLRVSAEP